MHLINKFIYAICISLLQVLNSYTQIKKGIDINIKSVWNKQLKSKREVTVVIIDTGIDFSHEDLKDLAWTNEKEIPNEITSENTLEY